MAVLRSLAVDGAASPMLRSLADASNATAALPNATYYGPVTDADLSRPGIFACYGLGIVAWHLLIYAVARSYPRQPRRAVPIACAVVGVYLVLLWDTFVHELGHCFWFKTFVGGRLRFVLGWWANPALQTRAVELRFPYLPVAGVSGVVLEEREPTRLETAIIALAGNAHAFLLNQLYVTALLLRAASTRPSPAAARLWLGHVRRPFAVAEAVAARRGATAGRCVAWASFVSAVFYVHQAFYFCLPNDMFTIVPTALIHLRKSLREGALPFPPAVDGTHVWIAAGAPVELMLAVSCVHYVVEWSIRFRLIRALRRALGAIAAPDPTDYARVDADSPEDARDLELV